MVDGKRERNPKRSFSESGETSTRKETIAKRRRKQENRYQKEFGEGEGRGTCTGKTSLGGAWRQTRVRDRQETRESAKKNLEGDLKRDRRRERERGREIAGDSGIGVKRGDFFDERRHVEI